MTKRLPPARDWQARDINDWNTQTFHAYMSDLHRDLFGCEYAPMRSWGFEQGILGNLIGTRTKEGTHSKAIVKRFIDEAFETYRPTPQYPGTNFGFIYAYRRNILQRLEADELRANKAEESRQQIEQDFDEISEWL